MTLFNDGQFAYRTPAEVPSWYLRHVLADAADVKFTQLDKETQKRVREELESRDLDEPEKAPAAPEMSTAGAVPKSVASPGPPEPPSPQPQTASQPKTSVPSKPQPSPSPSHTIKKK